MYQAHWGLQDSPFRGNLDPKSFFQSPTHEEALARLNFLVEQHRRLGLLVGPSGSGKSLLLEVFARQLRRSGKKGTFPICRNGPEGASHKWGMSPFSSYPQVAKLSLLDVEPTEMLWLLAAQWGLNPQPSPSTAALWQAIDDRLFEYRCQQLEVVVLFDDADQADRQALQHVTRLARFDPSPEMRLTIVLAGRNEGMSRLGNSLLDLAELRIDVEPWGRNDTEDFVNAMLSQAGRRSPVFAPRAVDRLHELAHGIPRRVSQLADLALLAGAGQNLDHIDAGVVETVYQELGAGV